MTTSNAFFASSLVGATPDGVSRFPLTDRVVWEDDGVICGDASGLGTSGAGEASGTVWFNIFGVSGSEDGGGEMYVPSMGMRGNV